jgi:ATPase subunit of ABC transporter with duplicated ATPase domains
MDEPTNHLDLESITALNTAMQNFKGNLIFSSHDHALTSSVANRIIEITPRGVIDSLMDYDEYLVSDKIKADREKLYK